MLAGINLAKRNSSPSSPSILSYPCRTNSPSTGTTQSTATGFAGFAALEAGRPHQLATILIRQRNVGGSIEISKAGLD